MFSFSEKSQPIDAERLNELAYNKMKIGIYSEKISIDNGVYL